LNLLGANNSETVSDDDSVSPIIPLSAEETEILMEQGGMLVDVRTFSEYEPDHVPNSLHIPVDELPQRYAEIGQTSRIIFICQAGGRAYSAAEFMTSIGATDIFVVNGGMSSWTGLRNTDGKVS
jgi:rhodanese-related sulfurtransferase